MCVDVSICSVSVSLSLAQEVENWWVLDGENCFKSLKVMQDSYTTSTCTSLCEKLLNIALSVLVYYYEVGKQWDIIKEISTWLGTLPFILVPVSISFVGGLLHKVYT